MVDNWVWETGLAHLGGSHLQGSSLLVASIQGRKLGGHFLHTLSKSPLRPEEGFTMLLDLIPAGRLCLSFMALPLSAIHIHSGLSPAPAWPTTLS